MLTSIYILVSLLGLNIAAPFPSPDLNTLLAHIADLPFISGAISDISGILAGVEDALAIATDTKTTENELGWSCTAMTVIFARGTTEPGNVGVLVGPPFFDELTLLIGSSDLTLQGVDYPASIEGFLEGGDATGSALMATLVEEALSDCPNTKVVMSGYSQGGQLVHNAAALLPAATMEKVSSVVIFGDLDDGEALLNISSSKVLVICHTLDDIYPHGDLILPAHLTYAVNTAQAASFAVSEAGL